MAFASNRPPQLTESMSSSQEGFPEAKSRFSSPSKLSVHPESRELDLPLMPEHASSAAPATRLERHLLRRLMRSLGPGSVRILLWDGWAVEPSAGGPVQTIRIHDRATLWKLLFSPHFEFLEAYARGGLDVEGDATALLRTLQRMIRQTGGPPRERHPFKRLLKRGSTVNGNRRNVAHHYDIGNDFYRLWLDEQLLYTCAYFESDEMTLEAAQVAKMDHICRKLRLKPDEMVIEAGCGWGSLALHMAAHYGVRVQAYNLSREQIHYARDRARTLGLAQRVEFVEEDWSEIRGPCDAFVSVGMLEHVGLQNYVRLGGLIRAALAPHGRGLIHTIGQNVPEPLNPWIQTRIFPGAQPPTLRQMMDLFESHSFTVFDVENLRGHYAETLRQWLNRFELASEQIRRMFDESFVRMWRMYLASSQASFETGELELFQVLFAPTATARLPMTRADLYRTQSCVTHRTEVVRSGGNG